MAFHIGGRLSRQLTRLTFHNYRSFLNSCPCLIAHSANHRTRIDRCLRYQSSWREDG